MGANWTGGILVEMSRRSYGGGNNRAGDQTGGRTENVVIKIVTGVGNNELIDGRGLG